MLTNQSPKEIMDGTEEDQFEDLAEHSYVENGKSEQSTAIWADMLSDWADVMVRSQHSVSLTAQK